MKILQIIDGLGIGGAEKLIFDIVPRLHSRGHKVDVVLLDGTETFIYKKLLESDSCTIYTLGSGFYNPFYIFKLIKYIKNYEIVHVHLFPAMYFAIFAKLLTRSPAKFIFTEHNTFNTRVTKTAIRWLERFIYSYYDRIVCISPAVLKLFDNFPSLPKSKFKVITNGIDVKKFFQAKPISKTNFGIADSQKVLTMVAGFRKQKDQDTVIKALEFLPENYILFLVGDGDRKEELNDLAANLNLSSRVYFLGLRDDVAEIYKTSHVTVLSSHWEGFGLAAVEAMASGTPLLASNVEGLAEVVGSGGILFEKGNAEDLALKILEFEDKDYWNEVSSRGIQRAKKFDIEFTVNQLDKLYHAVTD